MNINRINIILYSIVFCLAIFKVYAATVSYNTGTVTDATPANDGTTEYVGLFGDADFSATETNFNAPWSSSGTLSNFQVNCEVAPGAGNQYTYTVRVGSTLADSALSVIVAGTQTLSPLDTDSVAITAGQLIDISAVGASIPDWPQTFTYSLQFTPTTAGETVLTSGSYWSGTAPRYVPLYGRPLPEAAVFEAQSIIPTAGTLKNFYCVADAAPGASKSRTFKIEKNGVDSSIAITLGATDTSGSDTSNTLAVAAGDLVAIQNTSCVGAAATETINFAITFVPNNQGEWVLPHTTDDTLSTSATEYNSLTQANENYSATEVNFLSLISQATTAKAIYVGLSLDPGTTGTDTYTFTLRRNATTNTALTVDVVADNTTANASIDAAITAGDLLTTSIAPVNTPSAIPMAQISYLFYNAPTGGGSTAPSAPMRVIYID